jgi:hypothetical protein
MSMKDEQNSEYPKTTTIITTIIMVIQVKLNLS